MGNVYPGIKRTGTAFEAVSRGTEIPYSESVTIFVIEDDVEQGEGVEEEDRPFPRYNANLSVDIDE